MKTNVIKSIVIMIVALAVATSANAQNFSSTDAAIMASLGNNQGGCSKDSYRFANGKLVEKKIERHCGWNIEAYGGASFLKGKSDNWGDQNGTTVSYGIGFTTNYHKRQWVVDLKLRGYVGFNSDVNMETLSTKAFEMGLQPMIGFNPCGRIRAYVGATLEYLNSRSRTLVDNEQFTADIPFQSNAFFMGTVARVEADLVTINIKKMDRGIKVTKKRPVSLILQGKYTFGSIGEPLGSDLKEQRIQVSAGISFPLFF